MKQIAPDHDENRYYYDRVGRLVASQDGRQRPSNKYSYTLYDALGRVTQTGEGVNASVPATIFADAPAFNTWFGTLTSKAHVTRTYYDDIPQAIFIGLPVTFTRNNLRSRVATTSIVATYNANDDVYDYATHYSYDLTGDVATILQDIPELAANGHRHKRIDYDYDQLSGKVNAVFYQKGQADQFSYRYFYDLDNRLTQVMSSFTDTEPMGALWDREASYKYYLHGPLARTEIGHYRVQGQDYAYTLQGWIKGLNASFLNAAKDMGKDANNVASNPNRYTAADAFGYTLGFYNAPNSLSGTTNINDYDPIGGSTNRFEVNYTSSGTPVPFHTDGYSQYTGNIRFIAQQTQGIGFGASVQAYRYDQLMRLNSMNTYKPDVTALSNWNITTTTGVAPLQLNYKESDITYDRNGNILTYRRWGSDVNMQDSLNYKYAGRNQLIRVTDQVAANSFSGDFDGQSPNNYTYDNAGNLLSDAQGNASITWSPYGKVLQVYRAAFASTTLFGYDAMQNRVKKQQTSLSSNISTFYIRDAQGNVLAVYEKNGTTVTWKEQHLYGSSRLGTVEPGVAWTAAPATTPYFRSTRILNYGWKRYEINDHLGNVRALINDRKAYNGTTFTATLLDATDYFPFGAEMRKGTVATSYRYGFNGKELDKNGEFGGLNHYDYGFRIYNPGIGRFLSVDPLTGDYPELTPYQFAGNTPIWSLDQDGLEVLTVQDHQKYIDNHNPALGNVIVLKSKLIMYPKGSAQPPVCCDVEYQHRIIPQEIKPGGLTEGPTIKIQPTIVQDAKPRIILEDKYSKDYQNWVVQQMENYKVKWNVEAAAALGPNPLFDRLLKYGRVARKIGGATEEVVEKLADDVAVNLVEEVTEKSWTTVGRWMSKAEYDLMKSTEKMVEGAGGKTSVAIGGPAAFPSAAKGSVYAEFKVPSNSLVQGGQPNWFSILGPNASKSQLFMLQKKGGEILPKIKDLSPIIETK